MADEMKRSEFFEYMKAFEERLHHSFEERLHQSLQQTEERLDHRFQERLHSSEERLHHSMKVQFEETRGLIQFSLEAVAALRETTERGFADMRGHAEEQTTLLKAAVKHVRERVERLEPRRD